MHERQLEARLSFGVGPWVTLIWVSVILMGSVSGVEAATDKLRGPWSQPVADATQANGLETSVPRLAVRGALTAWHEVLTRADGPRSVMYPTASGFLGQAVAKHGMLIGTIMTADRLLHEWDEQSRAPRIVKFGITRAYDPVEANDFWWANKTE
jgi:uncharacterized protein